MKLTSKCPLCSDEFSQDTRQGRPFKFCAKCRKLMWYEKRKLRVVEARKEAKS